MTAFAAALDIADLIPGVDVSDTTQSADGTTKRATLQQILDGFSDHTLNVQGNTDIGLIIDHTASPTGDVLRLDKDGTAMIRFDIDAQPIIQLQAYDNGAGTGSNVVLRENNHATTPAAGTLRMYDLNGTDSYVWVDATGDLRIGTTSPTNANDTSGTVVGDQTSWHTTKDVLGEITDYASALLRIRNTPIYRWRYKQSGYCNGDGAPQEYDSVVGFDRGDWFLKNCGANQTPVLNEQTVLGTLINAVKALANQVEALQAQVAHLQIASS